jgi:choline kinase
MKAVIMAAGIGTRMGKSYEKTPKCLCRINGQTLLERHVNILKKYGAERIVVVIGDQGDCWNEKSKRLLMDIHDDIIINRENLTTCNSYSLFLGIEQLDSGPVLALDGDAFYGEKTLDRIYQYPDDSLIITRRVESMDLPGNRVIVEGEKVTGIGRDIEMQYPGHVYSGILMISEKDFSFFKETIKKEKFKKEELSYPLNDILKQRPIYNLEITNNLFNINTLEDVAKAEKLKN